MIERMFYSGGPIAGGGHDFDDGPLPDPGLDRDQWRRELLTRLSGLLAVVPDTRDGEAMAGWVRSMARVQACLDALGSAVVSAFDASGEWGLDGVRSPVAWLVDRTGMSRAAAGGGLKTARMARSMTHVSAASLAGELCAERVRWLTRARTVEVAACFDRDEKWLVSVAVTLDVDRLRVFLLAWRLRTLEALGCNAADGDAPSPGEHDRLGLFNGVGGRGVVDGDLTAESRELLFRAVAAEITGWRREGALVDDRRSRLELNADALLAIVKRGCTTGNEHGAPRPLLIAIADLETIARLATQMADEPEPEPEPPTETEPEPEPGPPTEPEPEPGPPTEPEEAEPAVEAEQRTEPEPEPAVEPGTDPVGRRRCEVVGAGPVPERTIRRLFTEADVSLVVMGPDGRPVAVHRTVRASRASGRELLRRLLRAPPELLNHGRARRLASNAQWRALLSRADGHCEIPGCDAAYWRCDIHHLVPWEHGGPTDLDQLVLVCSFHHHQVLHTGFTLVRQPDGWQLHRPDGTPIRTARRWKGDR